jgi:hypothetical protein
MPYKQAKKAQATSPSKIPSNGRGVSDALVQAHAQRLKSERVSGDLSSKTRLQCFLVTPPLSLFKKLVILTPQLVHALRTMLLVKAVPEGIKDRECKRFALQERPPVPYVPEKDHVQEMVSLLKSNQSLKTTIGADAELCLPIWHCGTREVFLMHVSSALDAIKKRGIFKAYKEGYETYVEQKETAKEAKGNLQLFATPASEGEKANKKGTEKNSLEASGKNSSEKKKASQKTKEGATQVNTTTPDLCAECKALYKKATATKEAAKIQKDATATKMFQFNANLLSSDAKYAWNKIVREQTKADPYKDLQGVSRKGPRGLLMILTSS